MLYDLITLQGLKTLEKENSKMNHLLNEEIKLEIVILKRLNYSNKAEGIQFLRKQYSIYGRNILSLEELRTYEPLRKTAKD